MKTVQVSSFSLLFVFFFSFFFLVNGRVSSWIAPQNLEMGLSVSSLLHQECVQKSRSEGHREEPELKDTGNLQKGCHGAGIPL